MTKEEHIVLSTLRVCEKHLARVDYAFGKISPLLPFTAHKIEELTDEEVEHLDQYVFRFAKLQDALGQKLFKSVLSALGEAVHTKSVLDIFNRLEQLGVVSDYERWNELRELRNEISHDYEDNDAELAEKMNRLLDSKTKLEAYLTDIKTYLSAKGLLKR